MKIHIFNQASFRTYQRRKNTFEWSESTFESVVNQEFRKRIQSMDADTHILVLAGSIEMNIFSEIFNIPIIRQYRCVIINDLEKLKKKEELLDDGDLIKLRYKAGDDNIIEDMLPTPKQNQRFAEINDAQRLL